mgnify:CR=1 FL=1
MQTKFQNEILFNDCKKLKKIPCKIEEFKIINCDNNEIAIGIYCNYGPHVYWSLSGTVLSQLMTLFKAKEWSDLKNKYCYLLYSEDNFFRGIAQMEPDGYSHLFATIDENKPSKRTINKTKIKKYTTKWWEIEYLSFKNFKLISEYTEK